MAPITNTSDPLQRLLAATQTPIADLSPDLLDGPSCTIRGVVTITWPYSTVKGTFAFILAEPDYRLRRHKGQVRINLTGPSAKAAGESGLSSGDAVLLSLDGSSWEPEETKRRQSLPGAGIDWQLGYSDKLVLQVTLDDTQEARLVNVDHPSPVEPQRLIETPPTETDHVEYFLPDNLGALTTPSKTPISMFKDGEYASPAFIKRARMSYGSLYEDGYDIFEDDGGVKGKGRKRTRFGRESGAWAYNSQSPSSSPEPVVPQDRSSSPIRPEMTDEGCQTMELDFPMSLPDQMTERPDEADYRPKSSLMEDEVIHQHGMVDHGVQGGFHNKWSTTSPASIPSFDTNASFPNTTPAIPSFQPNVEFGAPTDHLQPVWDPRPMNLPAEDYSHIVEPPPQPHSFSNAYGDGRSINVEVMVEVMRPGSHTRSPSEPNHLAVEDIGQPSDDHLLADEHDYAMPTVPQETAYPPLDVDNEERTSLAPQVSQVNYPASYLDDEQPFTRAADNDHNSFGGHIPAALGAEPASWATINNPSRAASMAHTDRLGSTEGESPDNAVVIDESDSDGDLLSPTAAEDTVMDGPIDDLDMYDAADVEEVVDGEFSDEDEPEYDPDEMGGDYDTRNYIGPDDDEDDSHDEDLRSPNLEPEFDGGESWEDGEGGDEEDEDAENLDYESEYEMADDEPQQPLQPATQSTPQVIDLISSSEDEGDDEGEDDMAEPPQSSPQAALDSTPHQPPVFAPRSQDLEQAGQSESEEQSDEEGEEGEQGEYEAFDEDEPEEYEVIGMRDEVASPDHSRSQSPISEEEDAEEDAEEEEVAGQVQASTAEIIATYHETGDTIMRGGKVGVAQSAAEGLEMLSQTVDNESNANNRAESPEKVQDDIVMTATSLEADMPSTNSTQEPEKHSEEHVSQDAQEEDVVDMISTLPSAPADPQPMDLDDDKQATIIAPSSPPLTHSFVSQPADEAKLEEVIVQETTAATEPQRPADQLPTPQSTQLIADATSSNSLPATSFEIDAPVGIAIHEEATEQSVDPVEPVEPILAAEDTVEQVEEHSAEPTTVQRQQTPPNIVEEITQLKHIAASPALSFQSQVDADDATQTSLIEPSPIVTTNVEVEVEAEVEAETEAGAHSDVEVDASGASASFISQMEVDEELQASIISQDFDEGQDSEMMDVDEADGVKNDESEADVGQDEDEDHEEPTIPEIVSRGPSPELGNLAQEQPDTEQAASEVAPVDTVEHELEADPSVQLARAANASRRNAKQQETSSKKTPTQRKSLPAREIPTPEVEDSSVQLARASLNKAASQAEELKETKITLMRHLRDELPDCTSLKVLRQHLQKKLDVIAVVMMQPPDPQRAKGGPREYMMSFTITDHSISPFGVVEVQLYRPHKDTLPVVKPGDVVLLRNFTVTSLQNKGFGLRTNDESSWAVFDRGEDQPAQIKGPPVEYGEKETAYVAHLRAWFNALDDKAREKLERANRKVVDAGSRSK
ncbi:hypothetical protein F4821DRAFT_239441 [Hypoxylon rubiginosum]|uniref:Uncharacterized protein n=1 Tax=Hypoxylon rubiginosum TaxID=110542 RepID=A0ACC0CZP8_9PEZI|nr:hypothetical protein F4821DRAFT_239441 [Hypoxylon rubiginosum]